MGHNDRCFDNGWTGKNCFENLHYVDIDNHADFLVDNAQMKDVLHVENSERNHIDVEVGGVGDFDHDDDDQINVLQCKDQTVVHAMEVHGDLVVATVGAMVLESEFAWSLREFACSNSRDYGKVVAWNGVLQTWKELISLSHFQDA